ncbi:hypothetical protein QL285_001942 [Trifolium repens]|nr:hypothetical protein QL285_001942 [Trifolium repens]
MAATLIVLAKLFATALMPATCGNNFFAAKNTFCNNFVFLPATFVAAKNDISCSDWYFLIIRSYTTSFKTYHIVNL